MHAPFITTFSTVFLQQICAGAAGARLIVAWHRIRRIRFKKRCQFGSLFGSYRDVQIPLDWWFDIPWQLRHGALN